MSELILDARKAGDYGIGTYIQEIFTGLMASGEFHCNALVLQGKEGFDLPQDRLIPCRAANYHPLEQIEIPWKLRDKRQIPFFSPHYFFPYLLRNPLIVTIHDLIHFKFPQFFGPHIKIKVAERFIIKARKKASLIFTDSEQTKTDLCDMFHFTPQQIAVVHIGVSQAFFLQPVKKTAPSRPYILHIGNHKPHKNLTRLLEVFKDFSREYPDIDLVLAGTPLQKELKEKIETLGLSPRVKIPGYLSREEIIDLIDTCFFFVFPSLYEGFGLPPLEAMSRGKAVLSSDCGSLHEVLGPAAQYVDPTDHHAILRGMRLLAEDSNLRHRLERLGEDRSRRFTWPKAVARTIALIKERFGNQSPR